MEAGVAAGPASAASREAVLEGAAEDGGLAAPEVAPLPAGGDLVERPQASQGDAGEQGLAVAEDPQGEAFAGIVRLDGPLAVVDAQHALPVDGVDHVARAQDAVGVEALVGRVDHGARSGPVGETLLETDAQGAARRG